MPHRTLKILIADDHPIVRAGIKAVLTEQTAWKICSEAENGQDLLRLAAQHQPDVAIVDYALPILNGLEAAREIQKEAPKLRTLIYTVYEDETVIRDALRAGIRGYLLKSEEDDRLVAAVSALASGKTYFSQHVADFLIGGFLNVNQAVTSQVLTAREREVVRLVAEGASNKIVAGQLGLSIKTVDAHRTAAMKKLNLRNAVDLARYAIRSKLIKP